MLQEKTIHEKCTLLQIHFKIIYYKYCNEVVILRYIPQLRSVVVFSCTFQQDTDWISYWGEWEKELFKQPQVINAWDINKLLPAVAGGRFKIRDLAVHLVDR